MTTKSRRPLGLETSLENLAISPSNRRKVSKTIVDTWEEAASSSSSSRKTNPSPPETPIDASPGPPPPTPVSPNYSHSHKRSADWSTIASASTPGSSSSPPRFTEGSEKRPEKSSAAAGRLIAGALGVKPPQMTEENKAYERAVREKERKRRDLAKEEAEKAQREKEEARRTMWEN